MLQLNHLMLKSNSLEQTSEGLQTRNSFSSGYQSYMHNPHLFPTEPKYKRRLPLGNSWMTSDTTLCKDLHHALSA